MSTEIDEFRQSLVAAVEAELKRHASAVVSEIDQLRDEGRRERAELRTELTEQIRMLAQAVEQVQARSEQHTNHTKDAIEKRLEESEARQTRRLDDVSSGLEGLIETAARPILSTVADEQAILSRKVESLDDNLRKFDEQAARMVTYFNDVSQQMEQRQDELTEALQTDIGSQIESIQKLVEENDSAVRRFQNEVGQSVSQKLNDAEDRFNNRLLASETRVKDESGSKIAEIDLHVSRVSSGLDETMTVLNDRIAALDSRFVEIDRRIDGVEESVEGVDQDSLEELKDKMSSAAGEAMLVRIEMERLEKGIAEKTDTLAVRMNEVESTLVDTTMDVSTAVQLDRLEEVERALLEIDPTKFVMKGEADSGGKKKSKSDESLKMEPPPADAVPEIDLSAIVSADEHRNDA